MRKKNRNYQIYKKFESEYKNIRNSNDQTPEILTRFLNKRNKALEKARQSSNESCKANRRVKAAYCNSINSLLNNPSISPKKKFGILLKLMKNNKFSCTPPLVENYRTINDSVEKSNLFNKFFASKATVKNYNDAPPHLDPLEDISKD